MELKIPFSSKMTKEEAYKKVKGYITPETVQKWKVSAQFDYVENEKIVAKGKGFTLTINFSESEVITNLDLSFLLKPLKNKIISSIEHQLKKIIT